ncbi:hypothetical protein Fmac_018220 [Flemingia macrophylla]|uniref:Cytidyltransferase-like domain-containing protein n=1 Tax=Flemingia macrophylla TaxID=520843 RepID=A0ABD1M4D0_9FABA
MLLCGSDLLHSFGIPGLWIRDQVKTICRDYGVVCIRREGQDIEKTLSEDEILNENQLHLSDEVVNEVMTFVRTRVNDLLSVSQDIALG